jgi:predicted Zn-ribbon and HTH transcriptional regulator
MKPKKPFVPAEKKETVRQKITSLLEDDRLSAKDISGDTGIAEREVYHHLLHIQKTVGRKNKNLVITPAVCRKCGFVFAKRVRFKKPGKCPICRGESIEEPFFCIE